MECNKCGCTKIEITFDSRGLAEARCADCGALIKKMKTQEVADYYKAKIADLQFENKSEAKSEWSWQKAPCRYCTENYAIIRGRMREARQIVPLTPKYCPMCGRELKESDRAY